MKDILYPATGATSSLLSMILGFIDIESIFNAFIIGAAGALGGVLIKYLKKLLEKGLKKWKESKGL